MILPDGWNTQGPVKPKVGTGPNVRVGLYYIYIYNTILKRPKNLNIFDELKYIMWTYESVLVGYASFESF